MIKVDARLCSGCRRCEIACAAHHMDVSLGFGRSRIWVLKDETTGADVPVFCRSCSDRPCVASCPTGALSVTDLGDGRRALAVDASVCAGCGICVAACPYGVLVAEPADGPPLVCDGCDGGYACVTACNIKALTVVGDGPAESDAATTGASAPDVAIPCEGSDPAARRLDYARQVATDLPWVKAACAVPFEGFRAGPGNDPGDVAQVTGDRVMGRRGERSARTTGWTAHGYAGSVLICDLTRGTCDRAPLDPDLARRGLGGRGLNSIRLLDELPPGVDPLGPENILMVGVGPLTGTALATSARLTVTAKSPQTGYLGDGNAGGHFGPEMRFAGFDQFVVRGCAAEPVYLLVTDGRAVLRPATHLWGLDIWQTTDAIRRELRDPGVQVLAIGQAGERRVRFAGVVTGHSRAAARTGMGAVMGAKNLKAIAVRAQGRETRLADPTGFAAMAAQVDRDILAHPGFDKRMYLGTTTLVTGLQQLGILPTRHFQAGLFEKAEDVSGEKLASTYKVKHKACYNCPVHCSRFYLLPGGLMAEGPEYETLCGFTSRVGNDDLEFALRMAAEVNRQGLDSISLSEVIGWLMECAQHGLIDSSDVEGLDLRWGNKETIRKLTSMIIRREGIGDILADGALAAARQFGRGTERLVMHVKGLDVICGDPRGIKAYGLTYAIASRGADHLRAEPFFELTGDRELARKRFGTPDAADRLAWRGKAALVNYSEEIALLTDALTMCKNVGLCMDILTHDRAAALLRAALGCAVDAEMLKRIASNVLDAERLFNLREGLSPTEDTLPERFLKEPLAEGPSAGQVVEIDRMIGDYYRGRGWGADGRPCIPPVVRQTGAADISGEDASGESSAVADRLPASGREDIH